MSTQYAATKQLRQKIPPKVEELQFSERKLVPPAYVEPVLSVFNYIKESMDLAYFPNPLAQTQVHTTVSLLSQNATFNSPRGQLGYTNRVLLNISPDQDIKMYLAGYLRMKIRSLIKVDISTQQTQVNALVEFSLNYGQLPRLIVDYLKRSLVIRFSKKNSILLRQTQESQISIKVIEDDVLSLITFSIDLPLTFHFQPYYPFNWADVDMSIWFSPFEKINNLLTVTVQELIVRYDDLMVQFSEVYTQEEFEQVQSYFKHLKGFHGDIRKLIVKVNLMNLCEPNLFLPQQKTKLKDCDNKPDQQNQCPNECENQPDRKLISLSKLIRQKYRQMSALFTQICSQLDSSGQRFKVSTPLFQNQLKIQELYCHISSLVNRYSMSSNKLTYEEEHLLGQYEIVQSELNVRYSSMKYFKLKRNFQDNAKLLLEIQQFKSGGQGQNKIQLKRRIFNKILLMVSQQVSHYSLSDAQIITSQFPSDIILKQSNSSPKMNPVNLVQRSKKVNQNCKIIQQVAQQMQRGKQGPNSFQFAHFQLSIYKHPFVPLAIVFFPLWIIATINLIIYFSGRDLSNRIANIATLLISYVAYFPIFRQQIPQYRYLLLAQIFAYLQIVCSFLTLLNSLIYNQNSEQRLGLDSVGIVFWVSFGITTLTILAVIIAYTIHKFIIEPKYKLTYENKAYTTTLRHILWNNFECDIAFQMQQKLVPYDQCLRFDEYIQEHYPNIKLRNLQKQFCQKECLDKVKQQ